MKKILPFAFAIMLGACSNEPRLDKKEEKAVEDQMAKDQKAQDSLEQAIKAQIDAMNAQDSTSKK